MYKINLETQTKRSLQNAMSGVEGYAHIKFMVNKYLQNGLMNPYEALAILLALDTGLRASDMLNLKANDIYFNDVARWYECKSYIQKTNVPDHIRTIALDTYNLYKAILDETYIKHTNDFIFTNPKTNKQFTRFWLNKRAKLLFGFNWHKLRKISAMYVINKGGTLVDAKIHLAHKRISSTDSYLGVSQKQNQERLKSLYGY